jgi:GNAT superfamily N-acetyltransferase
VTLPSGYSFRPPADDDVAAVVALINEESLALIGREPVTGEWVRSIWFAPDTDIDNDVAVVVDTSGSVVGSLSVDSGPPFTGINGIGAVAVSHHGRGIGTAVVGEIERRALRFVELAPPGTPVLLSAGTLAGDPRVARLMTGFGYAEGACSYFAELEFPQSRGPVPAPRIGVLPLSAGWEPDVYACLTEAFADDWEGGWPTWEAWSRRHIETPAFDPGLWFVVRDAGVAVGALVGRAESDVNPRHGWVSLLGVRPESRGRGIASALLQRAFEEFLGRGCGGVGLMVTFDQPTAASRLYERAGMRMSPGFGSWEKVLRPGG